MDLWPKYYHGPRQAITVLHRSVFKLSRAGTFISRHRTVQGAILAAQYHADQLDAVGIYRIRVQTGLLLEFEVVPRSDIDILFSDGQPINAYPAGAKTSGAASGVSASQSNNDAQAGITGAAVAGAAGIASPDTFVLYTVPNITLLPGATVDMSQYWNDPLGDVTTSEITNLDTAVATYSHPTLTGVGVGISNTLTLEVSTDVLDNAVFTGDFESGVLGADAIGSDAFSGAYVQSNRVIYDNTRAYAGSQSAKFSVANGVGAFGLGGMPIPGGSLEEGDELWFRCRAYFPSSWTFDSAAPGVVKGFNLAPNSGTARQYISWTEPTDGYATATEGASPGFPSSGSVAQPHDQWYTIEVKWKATTSNQVETDGNETIIVWQDGVMITRTFNQTLNGSPTPTALDEFRIGDHWNNGAPQDQSFWMDDIVFFNSRVSSPSNTDADGRPYIGT